MKYLALLMALSAGEYPGPFVGDMVAPQSGGTLGLSLTLPNGGNLTYSGSTVLTAPNDGQLKVAKNNGTAVTLVTGVIFGASASLVYDSGFGLRAMTANQGANLGFAGTGFTALTNNTFYGLNSGTACGMNIGSATTLDLRTNATVGMSMDSSQNVTFKAAVKVSNTASITGGTGAPAAACQSGDLFLRTDGASGSRLYVCASTGVWNAVAGV